MWIPIETLKSKSQLLLNCLNTLSTHCKMATRTRRINVGLTVICSLIKLLWKPLSHKEDHFIHLCTKSCWILASYCMALTVVASLSFLKRQTAYEKCLVWVCFFICWLTTTLRRKYFENSIWTNLLNSLTANNIAITLKSCQWKPS